MIRKARMLAMLVLAIGLAAMPAEAGAFKVLSWPAHHPKKSAQHVKHSAVASLKNVGNAIKDGTLKAAAGAIYVLSELGKAAY